MAYDDDDNLPPIEFTAAGDTPEQREEILELVEPSPGFLPMAHFCVDIIARDSTVTVLDFTVQKVSIRFQIDGIWQPGPTCLLYTSPSPRDATLSRMPSSA